MSRTYLSDVAAGRKVLSAELTQAIELALRTDAPDRLARVRTEAAERSRWLRVRQLARQLTDAIDEAIGRDD